MARFNKGQQALEYVITYGWAFVVVLVTIGAFAYFGFLNPDKYLPDYCSFGEQLDCVDFILEAQEGSPGVVQLKFVNNFGEDIVVWNATTVEGWGEFCDSDACPPAGGNISVPAGRINTDPIIVDLSAETGIDYYLLKGEKTLVPIVITFSRDLPGAPKHRIIGEVYAAAVDPINPNP